MLWATGLNLKRRRGELFMMKCEYVEAIAWHDNVVGWLVGRLVDINSRLLRVAARQVPLTPLAPFAQISATQALVV